MFYQKLVISYNNKLMAFNRVQQKDNVIV